MIRTALYVALLLFELLFLLRLVLSFFPIRMDSLAGSVRTVATLVTEPVVAPLRRVIPPLPGALGGFGIAELVVLIALQILLGIIRP